MTQVLCEAGQYVRQVPSCSLNDSLHTLHTSAGVSFVLGLSVLLSVFLLSAGVAGANCLHLNKSSY